MQALAGTAAVLSLVLIAPNRTEPSPPGTIKIGHWPEDVPCRVLRRDADGAWEITVPYTLYRTLHGGAKVRGPEATGYWERKCRGQAT